MLLFLKRVFVMSFTLQRTTFDIVSRTVYDMSIIFMTCYLYLKSIPCVCVINVKNQSLKTFMMRQNIKS